MASSSSREKGIFSVCRRAWRDVIELTVTASEGEKKENRKMMKNLIRSHYFLVKHQIPHTTTLEGLVTLQIENGDITSKVHSETCPRNATYESYSTIVELLASISKTLKNSLLDSLKGGLLLDNGGRKHRWSLQGRTVNVCTLATSQQASGTLS